MVLLMGTGSLKKIPNIQLSRTTNGLNQHAYLPLGLISSGCRSENQLPKQRIKLLVILSVEMILAHVDLVRNTRNVV